MAVCPPAICLTFHFSRPIKRSSRSAAHQMFAYLLATFNLHATSLPCPWFSIKVLSCYQVSHRWQCFGIKSRASAGGRKMSNADVSTLVRSSKRKLELITIDPLFFPRQQKYFLISFLSRGTWQGWQFSEGYDLVEYDDFSVWARLPQSDMTQVGRSRNRVSRRCCHDCRYL